MQIKRTFDVFFSLIGLVALSPLMLIIAFLILIFDKYPIFFTQLRVGMKGKHFTSYKFRTMIKNADSMASNTITIKNDPRITSIGKFLRKYKLDELPNLWNVLVGDMSFVGPRPDVPGYADRLTGNDRRVLDLRPGITGPATLKYANEEQLLEEADDSQKYNDEVIFPDKVKINLEYLDNWSLWLDINIIFRTIFRKNY